MKKELYSIAFYISSEQVQLRGTTLLIHVAGLCSLYSTLLIHVAGLCKLYSFATDTKCCISISHVPLQSAECVVLRFCSGLRELYSRSSAWTDLFLHTVHTCILTYGGLSTAQGGTRMWMLKDEHNTRYACSQLLVPMLSRNNLQHSTTHNILLCSKIS